MVILNKLTRFVPPVSNVCSSFLHDKIFWHPNNFQSGDPSSLSTEVVDKDNKYVRVIKKPLGVCLELPEGMGV